MFNPNPTMPMYKGVQLVRRFSDTHLYIKFDKNLTQVEAEKFLEKQWDNLPGFEFESFVRY
jgi:FAD synthase